MYKRYIRIFYLLILSINLPFIATNSIFSSAPAASSGPDPRASDYPPRHWYLKCFSWNASWSSIEWKRYVISKLYNTEQKDFQKTFFKDLIKDLINEIEKNSTDERLKKKLLNLPSDFKASNIPPILCDKLINKIDCTYNKSTLNFNVTFQDELEKNISNKIKDDLANNIREHFMKEIEEFITYIEKNNCDIICLQECPAQFMNVIQQKLSNKVHNFYYDNNNTQSGCCILTKNVKSSDPVYKNNENIRFTKIKIDVQFSGPASIISLHVNKSIDAPLVENIETNKAIAKSTTLGTSLYQLIENNKTAIIFGDFNTLKTQIVTLLDLNNYRLEEKKIEKPFIVGNDLGLDHYIFDKNKFLNLSSELINDPELKDKINLSHRPFTVNILSQDIFDIFALTNFKTKEEEWLDKIRNQNNKVLNILNFFKKEIEELSFTQDQVNKLPDSGDICHNFIDKIIIPILKINPIKDDEITESINDVIAEAKKVIYIPNNSSFAQDITSTEKEIPKKFKNARDIKQLASFLNTSLKQNQRIINSLQNDLFNRLGLTNEDLNSIYIDNNSYFKVLYDQTSLQKKEAYKQRKLTKNAKTICEKIMSKFLTNKTEILDYINKLMDEIPPQQTPTKAAVIHTPTTKKHPNGKTSSTPATVSQAISNQSSQSNITPIPPLSYKDILPKPKITSNTSRDLFGAKK